MADRQRLIDLAILTIGWPLAGWLIWRAIRRWRGGAR